MRKPSLRLGTDKPGVLKKHPWFQGFDWEALEKKTMKSPFEGLKLDENISHYFKKTEENDIEEKSKFNTNIQIQKLFIDYSFDIDRYLKQKEMIKRIEEEREKEREKQQAEQEHNKDYQSGVTGSGTTRGNTGITKDTKQLGSQLTTVNSFARINSEIPK